MDLSSSLLERRLRAASNLHAPIMNRLSRRLRTLGWTTAAAALAACQSLDGVDSTEGSEEPSDQVRITLSNPRVYAQDTVLAMLAERSRDLDQIMGKIVAAELNEIRGTREATSNSFELTAAPVASDGAPPELPESQGADTAPALPGAPSGTVGLGYDSLLRQRLTRDQLHAAYELLYLGGTDLFANDRTVWLVRVDVSVDRFYDCGTSPKFIWVDIEIDDGVKDGDELPSERIYALMPDFTSLTSQESWSSTVANSLGLRGAYPTGAVALQASGASQSLLEESFLQRREQPIHFAIYGEAADRCTFALGPQRRIEKRSWINPKRWFGSTYQLEYEIHPGTRPCMLVVSTPKDTKELKLNWGVRNGGAASNSVYPVGANEISPLFETDQGFEMPVAAWTPQVPSGKDDRALELAPAAGGTLFVETDSEHPVSSGTRATLHSVAVPPSGLRVRGKHWLEVTLSASPTLEKLRLALPSKADSTVSLQLHTPGHGVTQVPVKLIPGEAPKKKARWTITPSTGAGPLEIALRPADPDLLDQVQKVEVTKAKGLEETEHFIDRPSKSLIVSIPEPSEASKKGNVSIRIHLSDGKSEFLAGVFRYDN